MAASVRVEDEAFSDRRYNRLARLAGLADADHARGKLLVIWRQCTIEQRYVLPADDVRDVLGENGAEALVEARLGEFVEGGIRICGAQGRIEWLEKLRENGRKGGRPKKNQVVSKTKTKPITKRKPSGYETNNPPAPAPAPARSHTPAFDLEAIYQAYPKKVGKKDGCKKLRTKVQDEGTYTTVLKAAQEMGRLWSGEDLTYCPGFAPWVNQERWQDDSQQGPSRDGRAAPPAPREIKI